MNHASVLSSTVPVLPASGQSPPSPPRQPVPRELRTPRSMFVITNAVSARMTSLGSRAVFLEQVALAILDVQ